MAGAVARARRAGVDHANEVVRRMATDIQQFRFTMRHIDGISNILADHISRAEHVSEFRALQEMLAARALSRDHRSPSPAPAALQASEDAAPVTPPPTDGYQSESSWVGSVELDSGSEFSVAGCAEDEQDSGENSDDSEPLEASQSEEQDAPPSVSPMPIHRLQPQAPRLAERELLPEAPRDNLPIPHLQPHPAPEARVLSAERYHLISRYHGGVNGHQGVQPLV